LAVVVTFLPTSCRGAGWRFLKPGGVLVRVVWVLVRWWEGWFSVGGCEIRAGWWWGYGPNLQAFAVYLMVVHFVPAKRCVELLQSLTGAAPSVGFVHGLLERASGLLDEADQRIRALITRATWASTVRRVVTHLEMVGSSPICPGIP
jgi:Transposase IS66 family